MAGAGASFTGGLTLRLSWQKGQVVHLVVIHLPGGVDYKTNIRTFTVSAGPQQGAGRHGKPWVSDLGTPPTPKVLFLPQHPHHGSVHMSRWQQRCWRSCAGRWASRTPRKCRSLPSSSSKGTVSHLAWGGSTVRVDSTAVALREAVPMLGAGRAVGGAWAGLGLALVSLFRLGTWTLGAGELVRPLWPQECLNSVLGGPDVSLHSRRLGWETRLHFDNPTYISTHYNQVCLAQ